MEIYRIEDFSKKEDFPFHIAQYPFKSGESILPHAHDFIELVFVVNGSGIHEYKEEMYDIRKGDVFIIDPGVQHAYYVDHESTLLVYNVLFSHHVFEKELESLSSVTSFIDFFYIEPFLRKTLQFKAHLHLGERDFLEQKLMFERLINEYEQKKTGYRFFIKTLLMQIFINLSRTYEENQHNTLSTITDDKEIIDHITNFIERHHAQHLSLEQVSKLCGMSVSTFSSKFKTYTGKTFVEFRNEVRINIAKDILRQNSQLKIIDIAQTVGFEDISHFNRVFKRITRFTPTAFRSLF